MAMAMLKMDENVNLRLERLVNRALYTVFLLVQIFYIFQNIGQRVT